MLIERVEAQNFASYDRVELDLRKLGRIVSVFGSTGAGKTTLLVDAITFALFGLAYGQSDAKFARQVVPPDQTKSTVTVDFRVGEKRYRVSRTVFSSKGKSAKAFLAVIDENGEIKEYVEKRPREVTNKVQRIIGVDFKTFMNTIVVRQGDVAKLIGREVKPAERRAIFLKAFQIEMDTCKTTAKEIRDQFESKIREINVKIRNLKTFIKDKNDVKRRIENLEKLIQKTDRELREVKAKIENTEEEIGKKDLNIREVERELNQLKTLKEHLDSLKSEKEQKEKELKNIEELIVKGEEIKQEIELLEEEVKKLNDGVNLLKDLEHLKETVERLQKEHRKIKEKEEKLKEISRKIEEDEKKLEKLRDVETKLKESKETSRDLHGEIENLKGYKKYIEESRELLEKGKKEGKTVFCPVCKTKLTENKIEEIVEHLGGEKEKLEKQIVFLENKLADLDKLIEKLEKDWEEYHKINMRIKINKGRIEELLHELSEKEKVEKELQEKSSELEKIKEKCISLLGEIPSYTKLVNLKNDKEKKLRKLIKDKEKVEQAIGRKIELEKQLQQLDIKIGNLEQKIDFNLLEELQTKLSNLEKEREKLEKLKKELSDKEKKLIGEIERSKKEKDMLEQKLKEIEEKSQELKRLEKALSRLTQHYQAYRILYEEVFHEKGFPTFFLKMFLREVERYSRDFLKRFLSDKDIRIEVNEKGEVEIKVLDRTYYRDIVTYSGGETTLIGFAIRLGITKALAAMKGAKIPKFLVIDEGFGPLSPEFREAVLRSLYELSREFEKILVVSHVNEVRTSPIFTNFIKISKDKRGKSTLQILSVA